MQETMNKILKVLVYIQDDITTIKEEIKEIKLRLDKIEERLDKVEERLDVVEIEVKENNLAIKKLRRDFEGNTSEIANMFHDIYSRITK